MNLMLRSVIFTVSKALPEAAAQSFVPSLTGVLHFRLVTAPLAPYLQWHESTIYDFVAANGGRWPADA